MPHESQIRLVRRIWDAVAESGLEAALQLTDPDVEWVPHAAQGRVLTSRELLDFFEAFQGERHIVEARLYSVGMEGDVVLASGSFRLKGGGGISDFQIHFVYEFEEDRLVRGSTYATRTEALEAIARDPGG
ncbi:MAG: nuclear transport factor 2 family protein [Solirubrobacterales bacterium]